MSKDSSKNETEPAPNFGGPRRVIFNSAAIFILSQVIAGFIVGFIAAISHPGQHVTEIFNNSTPVQFFYILLAEGSAAGLTIWLVRRRKLNLSAIGLGRRPTWKDLRWAAAGAVVFYALVVVATILLSMLISHGQLDKQQDLGFNHLVTSNDKVLAFISLVILPPLGEEILMRGYLYSGLRASWKFWPALIVASVLFGLAHLNGGVGGSVVVAASVDTFILSAVLVYVRQYSGALFAGILIHATNNLIAFSVHFK